MVVGNSASGVDIAHQITAVAASPVLQACKSESDLATGLAREKIRTLPPIASFQLEGRTVIFEDGTVEKDVDYILFCTYVKQIVY